MPAFDFMPLLLWGLPLAALPVIIHLINLLKHRDVRWAAMEFLLASQKKYRTRVVLKQLLLLAMRVAAIAGVVAMLAQPRLASALGRLLGGTQTSHIILVDDSYSMGETTGDRSCFERGRSVVERIARELTAAGGSQELSVGRFSRLAREGGDDVAGFDIDRQPLSAELVDRLASLTGSFEISETDAGPRVPLAKAVERTAAGQGDACVVWVVSDFRSRDWKVAEEAAAAMKQLADAGGQLRLVDCALALDADGRAAGATDGTANLGIEQLAMAGGVPAAGVLVPMEVTVRNHAESAVRDVEVELEEDGVPRPGIRIDQIPPQSAVTRRFDARFPATGSRTIVARLASDCLEADNARTAVLEIVDACDVLLVDGRLAKAGASGDFAGDSFYLATALSPGAGAPTGLRPRVEPPRSLATLDLAGFDCIYLLDVERLDEAEIRPLEAYARAGGGVVFFMGPRSDPEFLTAKLHRGGDGLFPVPVAGAVDLLPERSGDVPDVVVEDHPVVAVLSGQRNPLLGAVRIGRIMAVDREFVPEPGSGLRRLLGVRSGQPLILEKPFGDGLVVAVMTTAAPTWNNWSRGNPSWVVVMLELEGHLARVRARARSLAVGEPFEVPLEAGRDEIDVDFELPSDRGIVHVTAKPREDGALVAVLSDTTRSGSYAAKWRRADGTEREKLVAVNVDPGEGELERVGRERLGRTLAGIPYRIDAADDLEPGSRTLAGTSLVTPLIYALLVLLLLEQAVAYSASYHMPRRGGAAAAGGRRRASAG